MSNRAKGEMYHHSQLPVAVAHSSTTINNLTLAYTNMYKPTSEHRPPQPTIHRRKSPDLPHLPTLYPQFKITLSTYHYQKQYLESNSPTYAKTSIPPNSPHSPTTTKEPPSASFNHTLIPPSPILKNIITSVPSSIIHQLQHSKLFTRKLYISRFHNIPQELPWISRIAAAGAKVSIHTTSGRLVSVAFILTEACSF